MIIMAIAMAVVFAFAGAYTYAYFTATATEKSGTFTTGKITLSTKGGFVSFENKKLYPGDTIVASGQAIELDGTTTGDVDSYVAIRLTISTVTMSGDDEVLTPVPADTLEKLGLDELLNTPKAGSTWMSVDDGVDAPKDLIASGVYVLAKNSAIEVYETKTAPTTLSVVAENRKFVADDDWDQTAGKSDNGLMDVTIRITIEARSIQAKAQASETLDAATVAQILFPGADAVAE